MTCTKTNKDVFYIFFSGSSAATASSTATASSAATAYRCVCANQARKHLISSWYKLTINNMPIAPSRTSIPRTSTVTLTQTIATTANTNALMRSLAATVTSAVTSAASSSATSAATVKNVKIQHFYLISKKFRFL